MTPLYDAHQHFHFEQLAPHRATIDADLRALGLQRAVVNGTNEEEWPIVAGLAREYPWILPSFGVHPWDCGNRSATWHTALLAQLESNPTAGIGEIGLDRWIIDGMRPDDPRLAGLRVAPLEEQMEVLSAQLALAAQLHRPPSIHCVQAFGALLDVLKATALPTRGFLLHGYGGPAEMIPELVKFGAYFSFNIEMLSPRLVGRSDNFKTIPADRLIVETDAPTKLPAPDRIRFSLPPGPDGTPVNHPGNLVVAYEALAELRGQPLTALALQVERNFRLLFL